MIDYQRTIDNIRSILASVGPLLVDETAAVAAEYAEACEALNERLRKCGRLLREGLRSEAIQQCEVEPNLLNLVATLDFPEFSAWTSLLHANRIAPPNPILVDVAADLNEAYSVEQPLAALLRRHRLHALGHSPLRDRILTLRRLAKLDANNSVWRDDLRTYEQARQQEIRRTTDQEYRKGNVAALEELLKDVQSSDWLEPPPSNVVQQVADAHSRLVRQRARTELDQIEPQLNDAFSQFDAARGRSLRDRWSACADLARLNDDDPLRERATPALEWLDEHDREAADEAAYQAAVQELELALDDEVSLGDLQRRAYAAFRFERQIPSVLEQRLRTRLTNLELVRSRRVRLVVAVVIGIALMIASAVGYTVFSNNQAMQAAAHVDTLQSLMEQRHFEEAQKHFDQLASSSPRISSDAQIQRLGVELTARIHEEQAREGAFLGSIEAAERAGDEQPDRRSLEEARRLALSDPEKARVLRLEMAVAAVDRSRQAMRDEDFVRRLNELNSRINALDQNHPDEKVLSEVREALAALITKTTDISTPVFDRSRAAQARVQSLYKTIERRQGMDSALTEIDRGVGDIDRFKAALEKVAKEFPESPHAVDFKRVAEEATLWKEVTVWNGFVERWQKEDISRLNGERMRELLTASGEMLQSHEKYPIATELRKRIPHLEAIARRADKPGGRLLASLNELFTDQLVAGLWMVEMVDDKGNVLRYYLVAPPREPLESATSITIHHISDFSRSANSTQEIRRRSITYSDEAPHSLVAKAGLDELAKLGEKSWESAFVTIMGAVDSSEHMEPVLKVHFLKLAIDTACKGSESLRSAFSRYLEVLGSVPIKPDVKWMDPKNEEASRARALAIELLNRLPPLQQVTQDAAASLRTFKSPLGPRYEWIGWLTLEEPVGWQCHIRTGSGEGAELFAAIPLADGGLTWTAIGRIKAGRVELQRTNLAAFVQGRPVFAVIADGGTAAAAVK